MKVIDIQNYNCDCLKNKKCICKKDTWDKSEGFDFINNFNRNWLKQVREKLKDNGTIWISGTYHNIFSIGQLLQELDFKILN